jgi:excisionase family DNA binding protein
MLFYDEIRFRRHEEGPMNVEGKQSILKTRDLAIILDLSPDVVNDMARRGHLKGFKSGNQWRFRRRDVERYIERMMKLAPPG